MIEIKVPNISFKDTEWVSGEPDTYVLHDKYLEYKWKSVVNVTEDSITKEHKYIGQTAVLKSKILGVNCGWSQRHERYDVVIMLDSGNEDMITLFETLSDAIKVKDKLLNWLLHD